MEPFTLYDPYGHTEPIALLSPTLQKRPGEGVQTPLQLDVVVRT